MQRISASTLGVSLFLILFSAGCGTETSSDVSVQTTSPDPNGDPMPVPKKKPPEYGASGEGGPQNDTGKSPQK